MLPGTQVEARGLRWEVVFFQPAGEQDLYRLRCLEGELRGKEIDLLAPFERIEPVATDVDPRRPARLLHWRIYHQAFLLDQALGPLAFSAAQPGRLRIHRYQLVPLKRVLQMSRPRLMLADGVGLGKTVEAGLILAELIARRLAHRILIVSPAGPLLDQWQQELRERFGLRFTVLDSDKLQEIRHQTELGTNPFAQEALGLTSIDFAKQERILQDLERTSYDVVVVDEAHHCMSLGSIGDREDSQRRRLAETLARRTDCLLLLTATPHDGDDAHFASLMALLDPSLVDGRGGLRGEMYRRHLVRRLTRHVKDSQTGEELFKKRQVHPIPVTLAGPEHAAYRRFVEALLVLVAPRLRRALRTREYGEVLAFISLLKRSVSSVRACLNTLAVISGHLDILETRGREDQEARKQRRRSLENVRKRLERFGVLSVHEEEEQHLLEAEDMACDLSEHGAGELVEKLHETARGLRRDARRIKKLSETRQAMEDLASLGQEALPSDPKLQAILREIKAIREKEPRANILIYSEFADSQEALVELLAEGQTRGAFTGHVIKISGEDDDKARSLAAARFVREDDLILVSTDSTAEGLNLHTRCHHLIHLELPYNPNRLEQRNGRIDRMGQTKDPQVRYLYLPGTFEERLLLRLIGKYERQRKRLTFVPNTLGVVARETGAQAVKLLEGLSKEQGLLFQPEKETFRFGEDDEDTGSAAYKELLEEIDGTFRVLEKTAKTHAWLGETGEGADEKAATEASKALETGRSLTTADVLRFVVDAVRADSADPRAVTPLAPGTWLLSLGSHWTHGLEDMPGYDCETRTLRLNDDPEVTDHEGRPVGYLGRAHPLVRRALDRVRNLRFGTGDDLVDRRVSAAWNDRQVPELLLTFLGRLESGAGRELERVVAVRLEQGGQALVMENPAQWAGLMAQEDPPPLKGLWDRHFATWGSELFEMALTEARGVFALMAADFVDARRSLLEQERTGLLSWFEERVVELCGEVAQKGLYDSLSPQEALGWQLLTDPWARLSAFATDAKTTPTRRSEAKVLLELFQRRRDDLDRRGRLGEPQVTPLGRLMLIPRPGA
ncbi:MAG: DEAD/DEAH box helicase family protein [Candidatus Riflebacteria bacterium]|nr:DEAD/DEAH box helicase family protein [Candidatus Riflebacteria bacterium]